MFSRSASRVLGKQASFELQEAPAAYGSLSNVAVCAMRSTVRDDGQLEVQKNGGTRKPLSLSLFLTASKISLTPSPVVIVTLSLPGSDKE